jgi:3-oxoacyl-[acyl-carrier protein] reductase
MELGIAGKVALVTGGTRGIGHAIVLRLAGEGCRVGLCARTAADVEHTVATLQAQGDPHAADAAHGVVCDVTAPGEVERFVDESAQALGGLDLLVANVGGSAGGGLLEATPEDWLKTFDLNLFHAVRAIRAAVPHMEARGGGSVVIVGSISGWKPAPRAQYGAAKAGEMFLAAALAWELAPYRIRVNTVTPGSLRFPGGGWERFAMEHPEAYAEFARREFPWGRLGTAEEVADVVTFLLSERARWINGASIPVDGAQGRPTVF